MNELLTNMKAIKERIDDSYDELTLLMSRIESDKLWKCRRKLKIFHARQQFGNEKQSRKGDHNMEYNIRVYKPELKQEEGNINNLKG